jgi:hypothetical protein
MAVSLVSPAPAPMGRAAHVAERLAGLEGRRLGVLVRWWRFDELAAELGRALPGTQVRTAPGDAAEDVGTWASGLDAAVLGVAAGGARTYWTVRSWAAFQGMGVRSVLVTAKPYVRQASRLAEEWGFREVPQVAVPHPFHELSPRRLELLARRLVPRILEALAGAE